MKKILLKTIRIYQKTLSPDYGIFKGLHPAGYCKFNPTCSEYTYEAINKYGSIKGMALGMKRILKCNPLSKGGDDMLK